MTPLQMLRRLSAAGAAVLCLAFACSLPALAQTRLVVLHGLAADFLPAFVAKDEGLFAKHSLDVTLTPIANSSLVPATLASGTAQIGINTAPNLVLAAEGGLDQVAIAGAARLQKANQRIGLVTRNGFSVSAAGDLRGKRIGVPGINSVIDMFLKKWLVDRGVALSQVNIIETLPQQMGDLLKSGQLDAVAIFEPLLSRIASSGAGTKSVDFFSEVNPDVLGSFWAATRSWATANQAPIAAFRASLAEAQELIARNPERARQIETKYLGFPGPRFPSFRLAIQPADLEYFIKIGRELGLVRQNVDPSKLVLK